MVLWNLLSQGQSMPFYSIYCFEERVELYAFEHEALAAGQEGRLVSTQKDYQCAYAFAVHLAQAKQLRLIDRAQPLSSSTERSVALLQ